MFFSSSSLQEGEIQHTVIIIHITEFPFVIRLLIVNQICYVLCELKYIYMRFFMQL